MCWCAVKKLLTRLQIFFVAFIIASSEMIYTSEDKEQPCLTPLPIPQASENPSSTHMYADWPMYSFQISLQSLQLTPMLPKISNNFTQSVWLNAFS